MDDISGWLRNTGVDFDRELAEKRERYISRPSTAQLGSDDSNIFDKHFTTAEQDRLREARDSLEMSEIDSELRGVGWYHKKKSEDPGGRGVIMEWKPVDPPATDAGSDVREVRGDNLLEAYRNARRELLG